MLILYISTILPLQYTLNSNRVFVKTFVDIIMNSLWKLLFGKNFVKIILQFHLGNYHISLIINILCIIFKIIAFFILTLLAPVYMRTGILLIYGHVISLRGEVCAYKTSLTPPLFIEVSVPSQQSEWFCICVLGILILPMIFLS